MMRAILAALLLALVAFSALALPIGGKSGAVSCPAAGTPSPDGSLIFPSNPACVLNDSSANAWQFTGSHSSDGVNFTINLNGVAGGDFASIEAGTAASGQFYYDVSSQHCGTNWHHRVTGTAASDRVYGLSASPGVGTGAFVNTTAGTTLESLQVAFDLGVAANSTITVAKQTGTYNCWPDGATINSNGTTINVAAGTIFNDYMVQAGLFDVFGNSFTLNGGSYGMPIRIRDNAQNPTLENISISNCSSNDALFPNSDTSCILAGAGNATVTLTNVTVDGGGNAPDGGHDHNVYLSGISSTTNQDPTATMTITNLRTTNVVGGGWTLKLRSECINTQCHVTTSTVGCTFANQGSSPPACEQNGAIDLPCGGNYLIDFSTIERGPGGDNWYMVRMLEEPVQVGNCPPRATVNNFVFDHDIFIWDGNPLGANPPQLFCMADHDGLGNCAQSSVPAGTTCTVTNSIIVGDDTVIPHIMPVISNGCSDGGGNSFFAGRTAAGFGSFASQPLPPHL